MKTVSEIINWLNSSSHIKCVLVDIIEVGNAPTSSFNFSTMPYYSNGVVYKDIINGGLSFSEALNIDGPATLSFGSIDLINVGGQYDVYLSYVWNRRPIKIYLGDPSWNKSDFVLIFDGLVQEVTAPNEDTISFTLFDKLQKLNDAISETTLKSTQYSQNSLDTILPLLFGECFNLQPLLVDNGSTSGGGQVYMYNNGPSEGLIEVRDNGVPINVEDNPTTGTFELVTRPYGTITCSAQGNANPYTNTVPGIITKLVTQYGGAENRFSASELDFSSFTNTNAVGVYCNERKNILEVCTELAKSVNANLVCPSVTVVGDTVSASKLKLVEIKPPAGTPKYVLNDNNILIDSLSISQLFPVKPSIKLAYCKNYTVQQTVAQGVNPLSKFDDEYVYVTNSNESVKQIYRESGDVVEEPTLLITSSGAAQECSKRLQLWQQQRMLISVRCLPHLLFVQLGDIVQIVVDRFGFNSGKLGMVYSVSRNWITGEVDLGVLV